MTSKIELEVIEQGISDDLLVSGYRLIPGRLIGSCLVICILVAIMWSQVNHVFLIAWALLMAAAITFSDYNAKFFLRQYDNGKVDRYGGFDFYYHHLLPVCCGVRRYLFSITTGW